MTGTPPGTIIRNQANVRTAEVPNLLTDGDGNPSTGPEPTVVVVGNAQQLTIAKEVSVVGGGAGSSGRDARVRRTRHQQSRWCRRCTS